MASIQNLDWVAIMLRTVLRQYGIIRTTIGLTIISSCLSVGISYSINLLMGGGPLKEGLVIAILTPTIITLTLGVHTLRLLIQLDEAEQRLRLLSHTDELTQTYNRRYFIQFGEQELRRVQRYGETFSIAIMDLDNFKAINDQYGHLVGDQVLLALSQLCRGSIREVDVFARYGGDEFIFLFPRTGREETQRCAARVFEKVGSTPIRLACVEIQLLLSMGVTIFNKETGSLDEILAEADRALYRAKKSGGNKIVFSFDE